MNLDTFPRSIQEPDNLYRGLDAPYRPRTRNLIVFLRNRDKSLQQNNFSNQSHHRHVLMLSIETAGSVIVDSTELSLKPGQGLLVRPFQFHHYINLEKTRLCWLFITFDLGAGGTQLPGLDYRVLNPKPTTLQLWSDIANTWTSPDSARRATALPMLDLLLMQLVQENQIRPISTPTSGKSSWITQVEQLLIQSIHNNGSVEQIAEQLNLSGRRLRTLFQEQTGVSLRRYRANYQVHRAMELMNGSSDNLSQIAERCGFHSLSVFTRFIRRETGLTPRELKRSLTPHSPESHQPQKVEN